MWTVSVKRRRAFTLVEVLIVVGIIAILISLLMPALSGARRQALRVKCRSNLQQVGNAVLMYVNDNQGRIPIAKKDPFFVGPAGVYWFDHLAPYLGGAEPEPGELGRLRPASWNCPVEDPRADRKHVGDPWHANLSTSGYGYNHQPLVQGRFLSGEMVGRYYPRLSEVPDKPRRGIVADAEGWVVGVASAVTLPWWRPGQPLTGVQLQNLADDRHAPMNDPSSINVLFFDWHVESLNAEDAVIAFGNPGRVGW